MAGVWASVEGEPVPFVEELGAAIATWEELGMEGLCASTDDSVAKG